MMVLNYKCLPKWLGSLTTLAREQCKVSEYAGSTMEHLWKTSNRPVLCRTELQAKPKYRIAAGNTQIRMYHGDYEQPNWDKYRRKGLKDPEVPTYCSETSRKVFNYMISGSCLSAALYATKSEISRLIYYMAASAEVLAMAKIDIKLGDIPEGKNATFKWRGKPLFIKHRTQDEIKREQAVPMSDLRDPQTDEDRCPKPEWLVVIGVCTHLGCVPVPDLGDYPGGYYCPCHGSHYDGAGRIRKGPAPSNLEIPHYEFPTEDTLIVG